MKVSITSELVGFPVSSKPDGSGKVIGYISDARVVGDRLIVDIGVKPEGEDHLKSLIEYPHTLKSNIHMHSNPVFIKVG